MIQIFLVLMNLFSSPVWADDGLEHCGSLADRKLKAVVQAVAFPAEYIQWNMVDRIERVGFVASPPSMQIEYSASYRLQYKPGALFEEQLIGVHYTSPLACEDLRVRCVQVLGNKLPSRIDPILIAKTGPLVCEGP